MNTTQALLKRLKEFFEGKELKTYDDLLFWNYTKNPNNTTFGLKEVNPNGLSKAFKKEFENIKTNNPELFI